MKMLSCFGKFEEDRICEICEITCKKQYEYCKDLKQLENKTYLTNEVCDYKKQGYDYSEREEYLECKKFGGYCEPKNKCKKEEYELACEKYKISKDRYIKEIENL